VHNVKDHQVLFLAGPSTRPTNSRWRAVGIFTKTVKSRNFLNHLADFGEIWRGNTQWPPGVDRTLKYLIFEIQDGGGCHTEIKRKNREISQTI